MKSVIADPMKCCLSIIFCIVAVSSFCSQSAWADSNGDGSADKQVGPEGDVGKEDLPLNVKRALTTLNRADQSKFYGAYKVGFEIFQKSGEDWFFMKRAAAVSEVRRRVVFMGSLGKTRQFDEQQRYGSLISELTIDCTVGESTIEFVEYKSGVFGTGVTVRALMRKESEAERMQKRFVNSKLQNFVVANACGAE